MNTEILWVKLMENDYLYDREGYEKRILYISWGNWVLRMESEWD
jgi:hypothetical protein